MANLIINCDGGSRGNPGAAASAFVVHEGKSLLHQEGEFLGQATNNVAEYRAVQMAIIWISKNYPQSAVEFFLDSLLVVNQLNGVYKIKEPTLAKMFQEIKTKIISDNLKVTFKYVPRAQNFLADKLVNETLDATLVN